MTWPGGEAMQLRADLADKVEAITAKAAERMPGRLEQLFSTRVAQLHGTTVTADTALAAEVGRWPTASSITAGESAAIDLLERFLLDIRSVDAATFATLHEHYDDDEIAAIMFRLALLDGFSKFNLVFPGGEA